MSTIGNPSSPVALPNSGSFGSTQPLNPSSISTPPKKPQSQPVSPSGDGPRPPPIPSTGLKTVGKPVPVGPVSPIAKPPGGQKPPPSQRPTPSVTNPPSSPTPPPTSPTGTGNLSITSEGKFDDYKAKTYSYEKLESNVVDLPVGVNPAYRELYLDNEKFLELFEGMNKEDYIRLQKWKRDALKKKNGLF